jgi:hypothetical protein
MDVMNLISTYLMPCKDPNFLYFHVKKSRLIDSNPIQVGVITVRGSFISVFGM